MFARLRGGLCACCQGTSRLVGNAFTERDNRTYCVLRIFGLPFAVVGSTLFFYLAWYSVVHGKSTFDAVAFGAGSATIWLTYSAAIIGKAKWTEDRQ